MVLGVGRQVFGAIELRRVHVDGDQNAALVGLGTIDQDKVPGVQSAHSRDQGKAILVRAPGLELGSGF